MAYKYQQNWSDGDGYVKYNITPDFDKPISVGDTITVSGQIYCSGASIYSIQLRYGSGMYSSFGKMAEIDKTVSKGKTGTFTITFTVSSYFNAVIFHGYSGDTRDAWITFGATNSSWEVIRDSNAVSSQKHLAIKVRSVPTFSAVAATDRHDPVTGGTDTPLDYFGGYIAAQSLPTITATFATDSRDTTLTTTHRLQIADSGDNVIFDGTASAAALATQAAIDAPPIAAAGTYTYTWTVTDSAGLTATSTGTLTVLAYSPPSITAFAMQRYRHDAVSGTDVPADNGDRLWLDLDATIAAVASKNAWTLTMDYAETEGGTAYTAQIGSGSDGQTLALSDDTRLYDTYSLTFTASSAWAITMTITDALGNTASAQCIVPKAGAYFDIEKTGVAVGMRSTGEANDKKFEVAEDYTSHFYGGIAGVTTYPLLASGATATDEELTGGKWIDGKPIYRKVYKWTGTPTATTTIGSYPSDLETLVSCQVYYKQSAYIIPVPYTNGSYGLHWYLRTSDHAILMAAGTSARQSSTVHFIMEYTKTTD